MIYTAKITLNEAGQKVLSQNEKLIEVEYNGPQEDANLAMKALVLEQFPAENLIADIEYIPSMSYLKTGDYVKIHLPRNSREYAVIGEVHRYLDDEFEVIYTDPTDHPYGYKTTIRCYNSGRQIGGARGRNKVYVTIPTQEEIAEYREHQMLEDARTELCERIGRILWDYHYDTVPNRNIPVETLKKIAEMLGVDDLGRNFEDIQMDMIPEF